MIPCNPLNPQKPEKRREREREEEGGEREEKVWRKGIHMHIVSGTREKVSPTHFLQLSPPPEYSLR